MTDNFIVTKVRSDELLCKEFKDLCAIKPKDPKWSNFPAWMTFESFIDDIERVKSNKMYEDDVILCGFPRSGTSMMQEMIWLIMNDFDVEKAKAVQRGIRVPIIEFYDFYQSNRHEGPYPKIDDLPRPRTFKSHMPVQLLPDDVWIKKPKLIYIYRNVKDVAVSFYHFSKDYYNYPYTLDEFLQYFLDDAIESAPYREHVLDFLNIPDYENILYLTYESVTGDMDSNIDKVARFLGKEVSEENKEKLKDHLNFKKIKSNTGFNNESFLEKMRKLNGATHEFAGHARQGKSEAYKSEMSEEFINKFDKWMEVKLVSGFNKK
ncbi:luciferin sulfotransferase-like [Chironomus tepperi]|uniref:luciferin sulfotransferase-like n=1 Tax=Chironomus tepperi TaxID=113505 RepID=UPI00391EE6EB